MNSPRLLSRRLAAAVLCTFAGLGVAPAALGQTFPTKPIRLVVPYGPGGATDILGRMIAQNMGDILGQPVLIDNKPGAGGSIGTSFAAKAAPDGYTLVLGTIGTHAINPVLYPNLPYDANKDFTAVGMALTNHFVLAAHPSVPARTIAELAAYSKGKNLFFGVVGYQQQLFGALVAATIGLDLTNVSYKGTGPVLIDLASGQVQLSFTDIAGAMPYIQANRIVPLAVSGTRRFPLLPDVPTVAEATKVSDLEASGWMAIFAPARTPPAIIATLNAALNRTLAVPVLHERFALNGAEPKGSTPDELAALVREEIARWGKVAKAANIKGE